MWDIDDIGCVICANCGRLMDEDGHDENYCRECLDLMNNVPEQEDC